MNSKSYLSIVRHYESCLEAHGDTYRGVDWPNEADAQTRYQVMLDVIPENPTAKVSLLDFGCGASHLYEYILRHQFKHIEYSGLDLSPAFINLSQKKFPSIQYYNLDILYDAASLPDFDYILMNGVFTEKRELTFEQMFTYFKNVVTQVFSKAKIAIAFNVMSTHVDWERQDLFHLPLDTLAAFLTKQLTRDFVIRNDYGLYEYTTYVYRKH
ncbi:MAG TPA: class I SAM-dependent methyltransferase [Candidatus Binatia bacterium]